MVPAQGFCILVDEKNKNNNNKNNNNIKEKEVEKEKNRRKENLIPVVDFNGLR